MDFEKLFNLDSDTESQQEGRESKGDYKPNMDMVKELIQSAMEDFKNNHKDESEEEIIEQARQVIEQKYGGIDGFLTKHFMDMYEEYEDLVLDSLKNHMQKRGKPDYGATVAAGIVSAARHFIMKILHDNSDEREMDLLMLKSAAISSMVNRMLPGDSPKEDLIICTGLLAIVMLRMAEIRINHEMSELVDRMKGEK